jgi:hypothetical protein
MSDGSTADLRFTRVQSVTADDGTNLQDLSVTGDWKAKLDVKGKLSDFVLHIQD